MLYQYKTSSQHSWHYLLFFYLSIGILSDVIVATSIQNDIFNTSLGTYFCDDELMKHMSQQMQTLNVAVENLRLNADNNNLRLTQLLNTHKETLLKDINQLLQDHAATDNTAPLIDLRTNVKPAQLSETASSVSKTLPSSCAEALHAGAADGIYQLHIPDAGLKPFYVYCLKDPHNNGSAWTVLQRRLDGSIDFFRNWNDYKYGFGNLNSEYFIGLEYIHALTHSQLQELWIDMEDFENVKRFARYTNFAIANEDLKYALHMLGSYSGDAGDAFRGHQSHKFTTKDADNDVWAKNCAEEFTGAWWYTACHSSNLNGQYLRGQYPKDKYAKGVTWSTWHDQYYSLKYVHMAIRPIK